MELRDIGKQPISEGSPVGIDVSYEPIFEQLSAEIQKLASPTAASGIDWKRVSGLSKEILEKKSKDFLVGCYLSVGLIKTEGLAGFALSIAILRDLIDTWWDTMFPPIKRIKRRLNGFDWWKEKIEETLPSLKQETWKSEQRNELFENLTAIDSALGEKMEGSPMLLTLINQVMAVIEEEKLAPPPPPESKPEPASEATQVVPQPSPKPADVAASPPVAPVASAPAVQPALPDPAGMTDMDEKQLIVTGVKFFSKGASQIFARDRYNSLSYRLNRIATWLQIETVPPNKDGKTMLPAPNARIISTLTSMYQSGKWDDLLQSAENQIRQFIFWFDLHRYVSESLRELGRREAADIVDQETLSFTKRFSGVEKLTFSDGTPFADELTKSWLQEMKASGQGSGSDGGASLEGAAAELAETKETIARLLKENKLIEAVQVLRERMIAAGSGRDRFVWELELCRILVQAKKMTLAATFIDTILAQIEDFHIDKWEPELAVEGLMIALKGLRLMPDRKDDPLLRKVERQISLLNPAKALDLL